MSEPSAKREDYTSRELTAADLSILKAYVDRCHDKPNVPLTLRTRHFPSRHLIPFQDQRESCPHTTGTMVEVANRYGVWGMIICDDCGKQTQVECPHVHCTWHLDGTILICDNCGVDGT